jgi:hypothetical protein
VSQVEKITSQTPLRIACDEGHLHAIKILIKAGSNINITCHNDNLTPLSSAIKYNEFYTARLMLQQKKSIKNHDIPSSNILEYVYDSGDKEYDYLTYLAVFKGAHASQLDLPHIKNTINMVSHIDTQYPHGSISYTKLCELLDSHLHDIYLTKLAIDGFYESVFRIIKEKYTYEGHTKLDVLHTYIITHVITRLSPFLVLTENEMDLFVAQLYDYSNIHAEYNYRLMHILIENLHNLDNDLFIQSCARACSEHINDTHKDIPSTIYHNKNMSILEKAIWLDKEDLVSYLLQCNHINIDDMYLFYHNCQEYNLSCNDLQNTYNHPAHKKYARWIFNLKHHRDTIEGRYAHIQKMNNNGTKPAKPYRCVKIGKKRILKRRIHKKIKNSLYKKKISTYIRRQYGYLTSRPLPQEISDIVASYLDLQK